MLLYHLDVGVVSGAFLSLSMFFTLSGYLIASQLLAQHSSTGKIDLPSFWERRIRRLLPASTLALLLALSYSLFFADNETLHRQAGDVLAAVFYVPNWRFVWTGQSYDVLFSEASPVQHFWSLGVEEQFYLVFPIFLAALLSRGSRARLALAIGLLVAASTLALGLSREDGAPLGHAYYGTDTRAAEVLIGVLLAMWRGPGNEVSRRGRIIRGAVQAAGIAALMLSVVLWLTTSEQQLWFYRGGALAYSIATALVIAAAIRPGPVRWLLSLPPLPHLGRISYGLYVYHWPIYLFLDQIGPQASSAEIVFLKLSATGLTAAASSHFIELPIRHRRWFTGPRRWMLPIVSMGAVAGLATSIMFLSTNVATSVTADSEGPRDPNWAQGVDDARLKLVVVGNSVAKNLIYGLQVWGEPHDVAVVDQSVFGCGLLRGGEFVTHFGIKKEKKNDPCIAWAESWKDMVRDVDPDVVVLLSGVYDLASRRLPGRDDFLEPGDPFYDDWMVEKLIRVSDTLSAGGAKIIWLTSPCIGEIAKRYDFVNTPAFDPARTKHFNSAILPRIVAARPTMASSFDLFEAVCPDGVFTHELGDIDLARRDGVHFLPAEAAWVARRIGPAVLEAAKHGTQ
jgi:peptidoglycan/LPS O-acetylase OafA/YrhL